MFKITHLIAVALLITSVLSCSRSFENKTNVSLSLPKLNEISSLSQCLGTCLKYIVIKIEGPGFDKIVRKINPTNLQESPDISGDFSFDIPTGDNRKFKIAAIYVLGSKHILAYGENTVNLQDTETKTLEISMENKGEIHGGSLVGRYITAHSNGSDIGPTGTVDVILNYNSDPDFDMTITQSQILNGWFDFMASENLEMTYKLTSQNLVLFEKQSLNTLVKLDGSNMTTKTGRIVRPAEYQRYNGAGWSVENEKHDIVYGFFPIDTSLTADKKVCFEDSSSFSAFNYLLDIGGASLTYTTGNGRNGGVYALGLSIVESADCTSPTTADRFAENKIYVSKNQLDGKGNDTAKGFGNAFTYTVSSGNVTKASYSAGTFSIKTLPGLFGTTSNDLFNNILLYKKPNSNNGGFDDLQCTDTWLETNGFTPVTATKTLSGNAINFSIASSLDSTDGTVACPTKEVSGVQTLQTYGGFYLGGLNFSQLAGPASVNITTPSPGSVFISITNIGNKSANGITGTLPGGTITFVGGNFINAGDCTTTLASGSTCQIQLSATSTGTASLIITYDDGVLTIPITSGP